MVLQSCNKLNLPPTDSIDDTKAFRNLNDVNMGVLGAYRLVEYTLIETGGIASDEIMLPTENTVSNTTAHRWLYDSGTASMTTGFYDYYEPVRNANLVLAAIPNIPVTAGEQSLMDQYQGELLALRAYCHFELLRGYASSYDPSGMGVPYMKVYAVGTPSRPTVQSNFDDINADLRAAKELISDGFNDNTRITRLAVSAIQARVALYEKKWDDAIEYASEVIGQEPLAPTSDFGRIWTDQSQSEVIWRLARVAGDDSRIGASYYRETGAIVLYAPSFKLIDMFGSLTQRTEDVRFGSYIKYDPARATGVKSAYLVNKYATGIVPGAPGLVSVKLFRTGEMYLIRAEAELERNNNATGIAAAVKDLNELRRARIYDYANISLPTYQSVVDELYKERFKELAFEGHRFFDLKRRKLPVERLAQDVTYAIGADKLEPTDAQYCFPIPAEEFTINKNMRQNPKYTSNED
ncbi:RagB/SusD family nutrient uptake outer membrane protein [Sphingobacterium sp. Ka21]|uniref:RagB/SusD family nutrient uptake outer membrane protein n=2 Tax=Sphingobacterium pedocola TaxID=2082722 RepID=A0ABR9T1N0_9SPHI|nr:RagB/SusD family nutrient uptake outer membrane protein [Sphingobacterium pedocola]